ncbi:hypothetical protein CB1_000593030 [Camelus ferus]|nr:hypothetical protein CB1_000593030 [Camelus ferus]
MSSQLVMMFDVVLEGQDASLALGLVTHIGIHLAHAHHDALVLRVPHDGGEDGPGIIVACEAGLAHAGAVIDHERSNIVIQPKIRELKKLSPPPAAPESAEKSCRAQHSFARSHEVSLMVSCAQIKSTVGQPCQIRSKRSGQSMRQSCSGSAGEDPNAATSQEPIRQG